MTELKSRTLRQSMAATVFPFNDIIVEGVAATQLGKIEEYLDRVFADIATAEFPPCVKYLGISMMDPKEAYDEYTQLKHNKSKRLRKSESKLQKNGYEIMGHDYYAILIHFSYNDVEQKPRPLFVPTVKWKSILNSRGSRYNISQIVADVAISIKGGTMYIPFQKTKVQAVKQPVQLVCNERNYQMFMITSKVYKGANTYSEKRESSIAHYVFVKYGVLGTFKKYTQCQVHIGYENEINPSSYPVKDYDIFCLRGISGVKLAILRASRTTLTDMLIASMFYAIRCFPEQLTVESIDDTYLWKHLLGIVILGQANSTNAISVMNEHINSVDKYVCEVTRTNYATSGIMIRTFYDLMIYIMSNYHTIYNQGVSGSMYGQQLKLLYYVCQKVTNKFTTMAYGLNKESKKGKMSEGALAQALGRSITSKSLFELSGIPCISAANSSSDNCYFNLTDLVLQDQSNTAQAGKSKINPNDPKVRLHPSTLEVGRPLAPKSSQPISKFGNACVNLDENLVIKPHEHLVNDIDRLCALLKLD